MDDYEKARKLVREFIEEQTEGHPGSDRVRVAKEALEAFGVVEDFIKTPPGYYALFFGEYYVSGRSNGNVNAWHKGQKMNGVSAVSFHHFPEEHSTPTKLDIKIDGYNM